MSDLAYWFLVVLISLVGVIAERNMGGDRLFEKVTLMTGCMFIYEIGSVVWEHLV